MSGQEDNERYWEKPAVVEVNKRVYDYIMNNKELTDELMRTADVDESIVSEYTEILLNTLVGSFERRLKDNVDSDDIFNMFNALANLLVSRLINIDNYTRIMFDDDSVMTAMTTRVLPAYYHQHGEKGVQFVADFIERNYNNLPANTRILIDNMEEIIDLPVETVLHLI